MTHTEPVDSIEPHDPFGALKEATFRRFLSGNFLALLGSQMQQTAVGWELYERTGEPLDLGLVGLVQVIPVMAFAIPAGQVIDRLERRRVLMAALAVLVLCSLTLALMSRMGITRAGILTCLFVNGLARTFLQPAKSSLVPSLVPRLRFPNAVTWSTSTFQLATVVGPGIGGWLIGATHSAWVVYLVDAVFTFFFFVQAARLPSQPAASRGGRVTWRTLLGGVEFVWKTKIVLGALTLDMFAVLLGGATALLPVYAKDILLVGPEGLGYLRAAPGIGALLTSLVMAFLPPLRRAGWTLLLSVAGFGVATIVFGWTRSFPIALAMLFLTGALDMISVIIRHTLVQTRTPDEMRGRVSAVNSLFIGMSNELGALESGAVAHLFHRELDPAFGPMVAVVSGGIGTLVVVLLVAVALPAVRRYDKM
ncbi:MAG: MFS transporter [Pirellulales bacterium]